MIRRLVVFLILFCPAALLAAVPASAQTSSTTVTTTTAPSTTGAITIAPEKRTIIKQRLTTARPVQLRERVAVGMTVPSDVELVEVPDTVVTEVPTVRGFRFFRFGDEVALVDPSTRRVVQIID
jgi:hypothetical protein